METARGANDFLVPSLHFSRLAAIHWSWVFGKAGNGYVDDLVVYPRGSKSLFSGSRPMESFLADGQKSRASF